MGRWSNTQRMKVKAYLNRTTRGSTYQPCLLKNIYLSQKWWILMDWLKFCVSVHDFFFTLWDSASSSMKYFVMGDNQGFFSSHCIKPNVWICQSRLPAQTCLPITSEFAVLGALSPPYTGWSCVQGDSSLLEGRKRLGVCSHNSLGFFVVFFSHKDKCLFLWHQILFYFLMLLILLASYGSQIYEILTFYSCPAK